LFLRLVCVALLTGGSRVSISVVHLFPSKTLLFNMAVTKPKRKRTHDPANMDEVLDSSKQNGVKSGPKLASVKNSSPTGIEKSTKKTSKKHSFNGDAISKKKQRRKGDKDGSSPSVEKRKKQPETGSARASSTGTEDDSSDGEDGYCSHGERPQLPEVGDEIAVKCLPVPPYPEGWYTGVVFDVVVHDGEGLTIHIEWDGGGEETLSNPEWRMKGDAPDKQGRVSHRDAKLRPYFKYWVHRLNSLTECEKRLSRSRTGKNLRLDPSQKIEWIRCSNPNCGKWRPLPLYMKSSAILASCNNQWYCVLNSWDEAMASCGAPQETGYMPAE